MDSVELLGQRQIHYHAVVLFLGWWHLVVHVVLSIVWQSPPCYAWHCILAWHGLWTFQDLWQHDQNHSNEFTAWMSFGIGTAVNIMIFLTQFPYSILTDDTFDAEKSTSCSRSWWYPAPVSIYFMKSTILLFHLYIYYFYILYMIFILII